MRDEDAFDKSNKVALWMDPRYPAMGGSVFTGDMGCIGYIRTSEFIEVQFVRRAADEVIDAQLAALDTAEQQVRERFQEALNEINARRADTQQLPFIQAAKTTSDGDRCPF